MLLLKEHSLEPVRKVPVDSMPLNLKERESTATMIPADSTGITFGSWLQDETNPGKGIVWIVKQVGNDYNTQTDTFQLTHAISLLKGPKLFGEHKPARITGNSKATKCTARQAVNYALKQQADWVLGSFSYDSVSNPYKFDGDSVYDALQTVTNSLPDAMWTYDMSVYPFRLNIVKASEAVGSELRAGRNLRTIKRSLEEGGMFTRFYPIGKDDMHLPEEYISKNEKIYGRKDKIDQDQTLDTAEEMRRWAREELDRHAEPVWTFDVEGLELADATGEPLDRMTIGRICRAPLPKYGVMVQERIVALNYPDKIKQKEIFKATLSNNRAEVTKILGDALKKAGKGSRAAGRTAKEDHAWFEDTNDHVSMCAIGIIGVDATGKPNWVRMSELVADGTGIHSEVVDIQNEVKKHATRFEQDERRIGMVVGTYDSGGNFIKAGDICVAINESGDAEATINASKIYLLGQTIANTISADYISTKMAAIPTLNVNNVIAHSIRIPVGGSGALSPVATETYVSGSVYNLRFQRSGNTYTLQKQSLGTTGWQDVGSFSRATTLSGAWSGGVLTVSASPQDQEMTFGLFDLRNADITWSGTAGTITVYANVNGDETRRDTGKRLHVNAPFSGVSLAKAYTLTDTVYYGRLYDAAGNALTSGNYYWYGSSYNYDGGSANATFYRHT